MDGVASSDSTKVPIILIHGMNGFPDHWKQSGFYKLLLDHGYSPSEVALFNWGRTGMRYNNTGDLGMISQRVPEAVDALCKQTSREQVDIVGYSAGGLVARAYLTAMLHKGLPHRIRKLVMIGVPNMGSFWLLPTRQDILAERVRLALVQAHPDASLDPFYLLLVRGLAVTLEEWIRSVLRPIIASPLGCLLGLNLAQSELHTTSAQQMQPGSPFLTAINQDVPHDVQYFAIFGDIRLRLEGRFLHEIILPAFEIALGDLLVDVASATGEGVLKTHTAGFKATVGIGMQEQDAPIADVTKVVALLARLIRRVAPPHNHGLLYVERAAQQATLSFLTGDPSLLPPNTEVVTPAA